MLHSTVLADPLEAEVDVAVHAHPSHPEDHWDRYRGSIALADLLDCILRKTGA
jgi:hypothetical protein